MILDYTFSMIKPDAVKSNLTGKILEEIETNGFKILSGLLTKGVKKEEINELYKVINWDDYEEKLNEIKEFFDLFKQNKYLNTIQSWGKSLSDVLSDGPTMNMMFILYRNWLELGKPKGFSSESMKIYNKNIFIILDRSFYEYLSNPFSSVSSFFSYESIFRAIVESLDPFH